MDLGLSKRANPSTRGGVVQSDARIRYKLRRKGPDRERVLRRMAEPNSHAGARSAEPRFRPEPACVTLVCA